MHPNERILIVDNDKNVFSQFGTFLAQRGYDIATATSVDEALEFLYDDLPDLILLDIHLHFHKDYAGFHILKRFKANPRTADIPVILLTADEEIEEEKKVEAFALGAVDYVLKKNFKYKLELSARVQTHLELKKARETKERLFNIFAHDLKNQLQPFYTSVEMLDLCYDRLADQERKDALRKLRFSADRVFKLMQNLATWINGHRGGFSPEPGVVDVAQLVAKNISLCDLYAASKNIRLQPRDAGPVYVFADYKMLDTVIRNLLCNAVKFTPEGGEVTVSAAVAEGAEEMVEIRIVDTGVGIAPENIKKILEGKGEYKTPGTNGEKGSGLGLMLCKEFVELNDGELSVQSQPGKGSTFRFTLPQHDNT